MFQATIRRADTPLKRIGLLCALAAIGVYVGLGVYWDSHVERFFHTETYSWPIDTPQPPSVVGGMWSKDASKSYWVLYDQACEAASAAQQRAQNALIIIPDASCIRQTIPSMGSRTEQQNSVGAFLASLFGGDRRSFWLEPYHKIAGSLLGLAILLYFGLADTVLSWVSGTRRQEAINKASDTDTKENLK